MLDRAARAGPAATPASRASSASSLDERSDGGQGALVTDVDDDSPAADAGLETGDVVISVDDSTTDGVAGVIAAVRDREPGDEIEVVVVRDGEEERFSVVLAERPAGVDRPGLTLDRIPAAGWSGGTTPG